MRLALQYMDGIYETFEIEDEHNDFDKSISAGRGLHIHTKGDSNFQSKRFFIPFTAIKTITIEEDD